jgi:c-di-GMP-binding flagellar brake protein YcgR
VRKIKSNPLSYVAKKMRAFQITVLRRKLGFELAPFDKYLESTREIQSGQQISVRFAHGGTDHLFQATIILVDDFEIVFPIPTEMEGRDIFRVGMPLSVSFVHPGLARYEFTSNIQQVTSFRVRLEHVNKLNRIQERRFVRTAVQGVVTFEVTKTPDGGASRKKYTGQVTDLSAGGLGFSFDRPIPNGTEILLTLTFEPEDIFTNIEASVLHSYSVPGNYGLYPGTLGMEGELSFRNHIQFMGLSEMEQDAIIKFIFKKHYTRE